MSILTTREFGIHPLAVNDALRDRHPPKFEAFDDYTFLLFKGLSADSGSIDCSTIQPALFIGERFLITRHSGESPSTERLRDETFGGGSRIARGPFLASDPYHDRLVSQYHPCTRTPAGTTGTGTAGCAT